MSAPRFRQLPHTADARLAAWGENEEELIRNAVLGTARLALGALPRRSPLAWVVIECWPADLPGRLVRAVNEALFWLYARREVAVGFRLKAGAGLLGLIPLPARRMPAVELKAATSHDLRPLLSGRRIRAVLTLDL